MRTRTGLGSSPLRQRPSSTTKRTHQFLSKHSATRVKPRQEDSDVPAKNPDLHGNAPEGATVALRLIDVSNDWEFDGGEELLHFALPMTTRIAALRE